MLLSAWDVLTIISLNFSLEKGKLSQRVFVLQWQTILGTSAYLSDFIMLPNSNSVLRKRTHFEVSVRRYCFRKSITYVFKKRPPWSRGNVPTSWPEWRGFKPGGGRRIFKDGKIQGTESSGRDFKMQCWLSQDVIYCSQWFLERVVGTLFAQALSLGLMRPEREANRLSAAIVEIKNVWSFTSNTPKVFMS
jgi:hypothetical protein